MVEDLTRSKLFVCFRMIYELCYVNFKITFYELDYIY